MRLIDADALIEHFSGGEAMKTIAECVHDEEVVKFLINAPIVDAAPVVHGRWINRQNWSVTCSVCGSLGIAHDGKNYCPYCGAKMDGERRHKHGTE